MIAYTKNRQNAHKGAIRISVGCDDPNCCKHTSKCLIVKAYLYKDDSVLLCTALGNYSYDDTDEAMLDWGPFTKRDANTENERLYEVCEDALNRLYA